MTNQNLNLNRTEFTRVKTAIDALKKGEFVILIDSEDRENEGDLVLAAEFATEQKINFLIREACGLVCLAMTAEQVDRLNLAPMVRQNQSPRQTAFTVSIEAAEGIGTGISPLDRAHTIKVASRKDAVSADIVSPGHVFPLRAVPGGVLKRAGHTEGSIELCKLAGLEPAAVICEIINEDGSMSRKPDLEAFSKVHHIPIVTIEELIEYQVISTNWLESSEIANFPTKFGHFKIQSFKNSVTSAEHALVFREGTDIVNPDKQMPLIRIHSECLTGDAFSSLRCDCGEQLGLAMKEVAASPSGGAVIYLNQQEGRGIGLFQKINAYALQDQGHDTFEANVKLGFSPDQRSYADAAKILQLKNYLQIELMTNNPLKSKELERFGIRVESVRSIESVPQEFNIGYLKTKKEKFQHRISNSLEQKSK